LFLVAIGLPCADDLHHADRGLFLVAMVEDRLVAGLHLLEEIACRIVAHAVPLGLALADQIIPTVNVRLRPEQPIGHVFSLNPL
jgi:hypothetical protein